MVPTFNLNKSTMLKNCVKPASIFFFVFVIACMGFAPKSVFSSDNQGDSQPDARQEAIEARRIAFLTDRIGLTPEEARLFWPVFNQNRQKREEVNAAFRTRWERVKKVSELSPEDASAFGEDQIRRVEQLTVLKRRFHEDLKRIISPMKIALLYEAERDFNRILFQEAKRRDEGNRQDRR